MPARILEHVRDRVPYFARRAQHVGVVAIREHPTRPTEHSVHGSSEPRADRLHPAPESLSALRLDDEVGVIALQRVVHEPKVPALARSRERSLHLAHQLHGPQRRNVGPDLDRHVRRQQTAE
jgi:hypothetical protein